MAIYTLNGTDKEIPVQGRYASVKNNGSGTVYASSKPDLELNAAEVVPIQSGESVIVRDCKKKLYVKGSGQIAIVSGNEPVNFFKPAPKGGSGGGSDEGITQQQLNDTLKSYATNTSVDTKLERYAEKDEIPTSLPANGGNADTLQGEELSNGNGSKGIIHIPADGAPLEIGGYIDFHYNQTDNDYTSRLECDENGNLFLARSSGIPGGTIHCNVDTVGGKSAEELIQSNPNLLLNPDFKVNQRGKSEYGYDGSDRYTVDRWKLQANLTLTVHSDYVTVSRHDPTSNSHTGFRQDLNIPDDTSVTLQACVKGNGSFTLFHNGFNGTSETQVQDTDDWVVVKCTGYGASEAGVLLRGTATSLDIKWIKLELGAVSTPFVPPNPLEEALKCGSLENAEQQIFYGDGVWTNAPSNPNLLDNPDFKVNQRGKSEYSGIAYAVDRWRMFDSSSRIEVVNRGIKITTLTAAGTNSNVNALFQLLNHPVDIYNGKQFTLSLKATDITGPWKACIRFGKSFPSGDYVTATYRTISSGINHWTFTVPDQAVSMRIGIIQYGPDGSTVGDTITVEWTKLEHGSVATPFIPPNPATELVKCQRYFFKKGVSVPFKYGDFAADNSNGKYVAFVESFPVSMRTTPTVTVQAVKLNDTTGQMSKWIDGTTIVGSEVRANGITSQGFSSILISKPGTATEGMTCSIRYEASADL